MTTINQADRVSFSFSTKEFGESIHLSFSTDIMHGETPEQAMERARRFVYAQAQNAASPPQGVRGGNAGREPRNELFDPANPAHRMLADQEFDERRIRSARSREVLMGFLIGQPLDQIGPIIAAERAAFKKAGGSGGTAIPFAVARRDGSRSNWDGRWPRRTHT